MNEDDDANADDCAELDCEYDSSDFFADMRRIADLNAFGNDFGQPASDHDEDTTTILDSQPNDFAINPPPSQRRRLFADPHEIFVVMVGSDGKPKPLPFTRIAELDGLGINLVMKEAPFEEQFVLILNENFLANNTKGIIPPLCCATSVTRVLDEFRDVLTNELPEELPPVRGVDHKIKLVSGAEPQNKASYRLNQNELVELKRQLIVMQRHLKRGVTSMSTERNQTKPNQAKPSQAAPTPAPSSS